MTMGGTSCVLLNSSMKNCESDDVWAQAVHASFISRWRLCEDVEAERVKTGEPSTLEQKRRAKTVKKKPSKSILLLKRILCREMNN